jgi:hypothetical protein
VAVREGSCIRKMRRQFEAVYSQRDRCWKSWERVGRMFGSDLKRAFALRRVKVTCQNMRVVSLANLYAVL